MIQNFGNERRIMASRRNQQQATKPKKENVIEKNEETVSVEKETVEEKKAEVVNCGKLRLRQTPSVDDNNVINELLVGTELTVLSENENWTKVQIDNETGYVMTKFLRKL